MKSRFAIILCFIAFTLTLRDVLACSCLPDDDPVCGENGKTYPNPCVLACENFDREQRGEPKIGTRCKGSCECCTKPGCGCTKQYQPVCGEDGKTYGNPCMFDCENDRRRYEGLPLLALRCKSSCNQCKNIKPCMCPANIDPVCGEDGKTYSNECVLVCKNKERELNGLPKISINCKGTCKCCLKNCGCNKQYKPVCGEDGKTYANLRIFDCENKIRAAKGLPLVKLISKNACDDCPGCICSEEYAPVCGSDGETYSNRCKFDCENKRRLKQNLPLLEIRCKYACDVCDEEKKHCSCNKKYDPVCGSDGVSYNNPCDLDCENFHRKLKGLPQIKIVCHDVCDACDCNDCICTREYAPVCGSDGITYGNICEFNCQNKKLKKKGLSQISVRCKNACNRCPPDNGCICPAVWIPVCGSDGKTYGNACNLGCENKKRDRNGLPPITTKCKDTCESCDDDCICPRVYDPVCGSDGVTYGNICEFECQNKILKKKGLPQISIRCKNACNKCPPDDGCICAAVWIPVCGCDGKTYGNACELGCENKRRERKGLPPIATKCNGACESCNDDCICTDEYKPVCGSDGVTYRNECEFNCQNKRLKKNGLPQIYIRCKNACRGCPPDKKCICPSIYKPVCGSDGRTYGSWCLFNCENRRRLEHGLPILVLTKNGPC